MKKDFVKINFQDIEIAESFFENEKHLSEFLYAVVCYYRKKNTPIKSRIVKKYFETYKKTMDYILEAKEKGKYGAVIKAELQQLNEATLEGGLEESLEGKRKEEREKKKEERENTEDFVGLDFCEVYQKWMEYKKERKETYAGKKSKEQFYKNLLKLSGNNPIIAEEIVNQSMANNWAGIFELKNKPSFQQTNNNTKGTIKDNNF
jgi:hypothetical protein